jgi:hypothetical protein
MIKLYEIKFNNERKKLFPIINIENIYITTYNDHYKFIKKKKLKKIKKNILIYYQYQNSKNINISIKIYL